MPSFPYVIVNAFTRSPFGGNPAIIIQLPPGSLASSPPSPPIIDTPTMAAVAKSFSQPIAVFVAPSETDDGDSDDLFDIRFFVGDLAVPICGHGTLATTMAIYKDLFHGLTTPHARTAFRFRTTTGAILRARAVLRPDKCANTSDDDALYEIELPATPTEPLLGKDRERIHVAIARALRTDPASLDIRTIERGTGTLDSFLMVVLQADQDLDGRDIDIPALLDATPFQMISLSHLTLDKPYAFASRVFGPVFGLPEDQVCGAAHTLMVPFYASLPDGRFKPGEEAHVRQVSRRGGDLWVTFDEERKVVVFRGNAKLFAKGELML